MGFFDIGPLELLLVFILALIIWGPNRIPEIARTIGKTMRAFRRATFDLTTAVTRELNLEEQQKPSGGKPTITPTPEGHKVPEHLETPGTEG